MTENLNSVLDLLDEVGVAVVLLALVAVIGVLLERTHRRTRALPHDRTPSWEREPDRDLVRTFDELRALPTSQPGRRIRPVS